MRERVFEMTAKSGHVFTVRACSKGELHDGLRAHRWEDPETSAVQLWDRWESRFEDYRGQMREVSP